MKIMCIFAQRKCRYEGQYAPELIAAIDEYGNDENPAYLDDHESSLESQGDIHFSKRIEVNVDDEEFDRVFFGDNQVKGVISP